MARPFKVSPHTSLRGAALVAEVRQTYPLSKPEERALRDAVKNILVQRLSRRSAAKLAREFDVGRAAAVLGVKAGDLRQELAGHGVAGLRVRPAAGRPRERAVSAMKRKRMRPGKTQGTGRSSGARGRA